MTLHRSLLTSLSTKNNDLTQVSPADDKEALQQLQRLKTVVENVKQHKINLFLEHFKPNRHLLNCLLETKAEIDAEEKLASPDSWLDMLSDMLIDGKIDLANEKVKTFFKLHPKTFGSSALEIYAKVWRLFDLSANSDLFGSSEAAIKILTDLCRHQCNPVYIGLLATCHLDVLISCLQNYNYYASFISENNLLNLIDFWQAKENFSIVEFNANSITNKISLSFDKTIMPSPIDLYYSKELHERLLRRNKVDEVIWQESTEELQSLWKEECGEFITNLINNFSKLFDNLIANAGNHIEKLNSENIASLMRNRSICEAILNSESGPLLILANKLNAENIKTLIKYYFKNSSEDKNQGLIVTSLILGNETLCKKLCAETSLYELGKILESTKFIDGAELCFQKGAQLKEEKSMDAHQNYQFLNVLKRKYKDIRKNKFFKTDDFFATPRTYEQTIRKVAANPDSDTAKAYELAKKVFFFMQTKAPVIKALHATSSVPAVQVTTGNATIKDNDLDGESTSLITNSFFNIDNKTLDDVRRREMLGDELMDTYLSRREM